MPELQWSNKCLVCGEIFTEKSHRLVCDTCVVINSDNLAPIYNNTTNRRNINVSSALEFKKRLSPHERAFFNPYSSTIANKLDDEEPYFTIVCVMHNNVDMALTCIKSVVNGATLKGEFILYDNGSDDKTVTIIENSLANIFKDSTLNYKLIKGAENVGIGAYKLALQKADTKSNLFVSIDTDLVYIAPRWMEWFVDKFNRYPEMGLGLVLDLRYYVVFQELFNVVMWEEPLNLDGAKLHSCFGHGFLMCFRPEDYHAVGGFPYPAINSHDCVIEEKISHMLKKNIYAFRSLPTVHLGEDGRETYYGYKSWR